MSSAGAGGLCYYQVPGQHQKILEHLMFPSTHQLCEELRQQPSAQMFRLVLLGYHGP